METHVFRSLIVLAGVATIAATLAAAASMAHATGCNSAASRIGTDIGKQMAVILASAGCTAVTSDWSSCYEQASKWADIVSQATEYWNKMANGSWATIGPRPLVLNEYEEGRLVGTGGRVFVTTTTVPTSSCKVVIKEQDGKGKVGIAICKVNESGELSNLKEVTVNDSTSDKKNQSQTFEYTLSGVKNSVIQIHMDGKSATNTFSYKIKVLPQ